MIFFQNSQTVLIQNCIYDAFTFTHDSDINSMKGKILINIKIRRAIILPLHNSCFETRVRLIISRRKTKKTISIHLYRITYFLRKWCIESGF